MKPAEDQSELLQSLDVLLEQYLHLLDRQQKLQYGLAKELSSVCPFEAICPDSRLIVLQRDSWRWPMQTTPVLLADDMEPTITMSG